MSHKNLIIDVRSIPNKFPMMQVMSGCKFNSKTALINFLNLLIELGKYAAKLRCYNYVYNRP